jgi:DNA-binding transcriptional LysR family regulator
MFRAEAMQLTRLETFVEVVRRGTFAGAAEALSFTPSAVSQQIARLEAEAGAPLLVRAAGGVELTEAGRLLHAHALGIVAAVADARAGLDALRGEQVKRLRIGVCPVAAAAVLPQALRLLRRRLPAAELVLEEDTAAGVREAVLAGRLEAGAWAGPVGPERPGETVLLRAPLLVALPERHPLARLGVLDAAALAATALVGEGLSLGAVRRVHERVRSLPARLALVAAGEGFALVPEGGPLPDGVVLRPLAGAPEWELRAARPAGDVPSVGSLAVLDALRRVRPIAGARASAFPASAR